MVARSVAGRNFVVAAGHPEAARAARIAFDRGGSVADAAIAASAVLCVALPQATTLGGDLLGLYHDAASGTLLGLDAAGVAPARATASLFAGGMPKRGACASVVPGIVAGWAALHDRLGKLPWSSLLTPAVRLAADGMPRSRGMAEFLGECAQDLAADPGCRTLFPQGDAGTWFRQPALAATLSRIADEGAQEFYRGRTAQLLAAFTARASGLMDANDLRQYAARWVEPLCSSYRGREVHVLPPSSFGLLLLLQLAGLGSLQQLDLRSMSDRFEAQLRATRAAFAIGESLAYDAHPALCTAQLQPLLDAMRQAMRMPAAALPGDGFGGTACVVAGDAKGNAAVLVQSVYQPFGAACADPETGVLLNNRMFGFSATPGDDNCVMPGKRPRHTLCPAMVFERGVPRWALASPGGLSQSVTLAQVLVNLMDRKLSPADAISAPRWCLSRNRDVLVEPAFRDLLQGYGNMDGFKVQHDTYSFGSAKLVAWEADGGLTASADWRRDATVAGC